MSLNKKIISLIKRKRMKLAIAESCTGGMLSSTITSVSGSSKVCVSITGIAGPKGGSKQKPVGLVYIGIKVGKKVIVNKCNFKNKGRAYIQKQTVKKSLNLLSKFISIS